MGMSGVRNLKVWTAHLIAALSLVLLAGVLLAGPAHAETFTVNSAGNANADPSGPSGGVCDGNASSSGSSSRAPSRRPTPTE